MYRFAKQAEDSAKHCMAKAEPLWGTASAVPQSVRNSDGFSRWLFVRPALNGILKAPHDDSMH
jgi:hypothetical protein